MQRKYILLSAALFTTLSASAQDRIYTRDGGIYEVKIKEIGTRNIIYKKWNNQNGPDYVMPKNNAEKIKFQNGDEETFGEKARLHREPSIRRTNEKYGQNIISISPVHMTNISPVGFGIFYERILDRNSVVSLYLPVAYSFKNSGSSTFGNYPVNDKSNVFWFYPGAKIYPTGNNGMVRYSVGPSLAFGAGSRSYVADVYNSQTGGYVPTRFQENLFIMGFLVNNTLNIYPTPKLHLGLELGLGIPYYTNENENRHNGYYYSYNTFNDEPLVQFNFKVGYRF